MAGGPRALESWGCVGGARRAPLRCPSVRVPPGPPRAQRGGLGSLSGPSRDARVLVRARRSDGEPDQLRHDHARRLDAPHPPGLAGDDADPARPRRLVADHAAEAPGALRVLLRVPSWERLDRARLLLRLAPDVGGYSEAALHHDGHAGAPLVDPTRRHVDRRDDQAAGRPAVEAPAPTRVPRRSGGALPPSLSCAEAGGRPLL